MKKYKNEKRQETIKKFHQQEESLLELEQEAEIKGMIETLQSLDYSKEEIEIFMCENKGYKPENAKIQIDKYWKIR